MIAADLRRIRKARRAIARPALRALLESAAYKAIVPLTGQPIDDERVLRRALDLVEAAFWAVADAGALRYFGIRSSFELGRCVVDLEQVDEMGTVRVLVGDAVEAILDGGARGAGWRSTRELTVEDLER